MKKLCKRLPREVTRSRVWMPCTVLLQETLLFPMLSATVHSMSTCDTLKAPGMVMHGLVIEGHLWHCQRQMGAELALKQPGVRVASLGSLRMTSCGAAPAECGSGFSCLAVLRLFSAKQLLFWDVQLPASTAAPVRATCMCVCSCSSCSPICMGLHGSLGLHGSFCKHVGSCENTSPSWGCYCCVLLPCLCRQRGL